jgi:hypothetical protein
MGPHILVVGGTGMLAGLCRALAEDGGRLSLLSRRASAMGGFDCDYYDPVSFQAALEAAEARNGPIELAVGWFHNIRLEACRLLAERVRGRLFQVLGSAMADPGHPWRLDLAKAVAAGLPACDLRQVVLGFKVEDRGARWLTNDEISDGVLAAIRGDFAYSVIGQTEPWTARPS